MGYVDKNLMKNERVIYKANTHWSIYIPSILYSVVALLFFNVETESGLMLFGYLFMVVATYYFLKAYVISKSIELVITSKRVIAKVGIIRRRTLELNHTKVESFSVDQSILGRLFGSGTLIVNGTGGGKLPVPNIGDPLEFRRNAMEAIDAYET